MYRRDLMSEAERLTRSAGIQRLEPDYEQARCCCVYAIQ